MAAGTLDSCCLFSAGALAGWGIYYLGTVKQTLPVQQPVVQAPVATPRSQIAEQPADSNAAIVKKILPQYKDYDNNSNVNFFKNNRFKTEAPSSQS